MIVLLSRKVLWSCIGTIVASALIYGGLWAALAFGARDITEDWITKQRQDGWAIAASATRIDGFPGWPVVALEDVAVTAPLEEGAWSWSAERITLVPAAFDLTQLTIRTPGRHTFNAPWATNGPLIANAARADFEIDIDSRGRLQRGHVTLEDTELLDARRVPLVRTSLLDLELALADSTDQTDDVFARFTGRSDNLRPAMNLRPFDPIIRTVRLDADLIGEFQPGRLQDALDAWRQGGGTLEVRRIFLDWPPLTIDAGGTVALDEALQPIAAFSTRITGFKDALRALETNGAIKKGQAASAQVILSLLAKTPPGGDAPELQVPLSIQDQRLTVGPFDVMRVPAVRWE
ncbi:MAG: DUF2125 domain-containing protein [Rhodospirillaceae bacterium]|jgi:hypothetical protein|nr:DUF2125 domain-containing protein [Rhodospirillaceae bacterium]MBT5565705.1 DUF2125 domain-containing protein [Rhodospirillaceae bacterium]MBT6090780.1 DUF2125 domain-containing protein [Rhodospirillaceae bacterium]MBT7449742.1 DUF2125 domain-containing protein [Rhodospirillaceae bacterium]